VPDAITPLLAALGKTDAQVAASLRADGITAWRGATTFHNPIVSYIYRHLDVGRHLLILVWGRELTVARHRSRHTIPIPEAVSAFLTRFHRGEFPELEEPWQRI
jgi:hypothetical protein